jgi:hypothetical protein
LPEAQFFCGLDGDEDTRSTFTADSNEAVESGAVGKILNHRAGRMNMAGRVSVRRVC